jgi:hypothetical protein
MRQLALALATATFFGFSATANAALILSFDGDNTAAQDGVFSYDGTPTGTLIGTGIDFLSVQGTGTPAEDGTILVCEDCELDFQTGSIVSSVGGFYTFSGGGSFILSGTLFEGGTQVAGGTLLSGSFIHQPSVVISGTSGISLSFGIDEKNEDLLAFYGITQTDFTFAATNIALAGVTLNGNAFTANVTSASIDNTPVPEPATLGLLGIGLLGLGAMLRRRAT